MPRATGQRTRSWPGSRPFLEANGGLSVHLIIGEAALHQQVGGSE